MKKVVLSFFLLMICLVVILGRGGRVYTVAVVSLHGGKVFDNVVKGIFDGLEGIDDVEVSVRNFGGNLANMENFVAAVGGDEDVDGVVFGDFGGYVLGKDVGKAVVGVFDEDVVCVGGEVNGVVGRMGVNRFWDVVSELLSMRSKVVVVGGFCEESFDRGERLVKVVRSSGVIAENVVLHNVGDVDNLKEIIGEDVEGIIVVEDFFTMEGMEVLADFATARGIPLVGSGSVAVDCGACFSFGYGERAVGREVGKMVNFLLKGGNLGVSVIGMEGEERVVVDESALVSQGIEVGYFRDVCGDRQLRMLRL